MRRPRERLHDILNAIDRIDSLRSSGRSAFLSDIARQDAMIYQIAVIGEAANDLPKELLAAHPDVPWRRIIGMRNRLIHEYFRVDLGVIWTFAEREVEPLKRVAKVMLSKMSESEG